MNNIYAQNFEDEREQRENEKYGPRLPISLIAAHPHVYQRHSIPFPYGHFDEPSQEIV